MTEPKWLTLAKKEVGTKEFSGSRNNPTVQNYYKDAVGSKHPDAVPWCAAFVGAMLSRSGIKPSGSLLAKSYLNWGIKLSKPVPGAIAVFGRGAGGHVAFVIADAGRSLKIVGGNQSNAVTITGRSKATLLGYRWPKDTPVIKGLTLAIEDEAPKQKFIITGHDIEIEECELP